jgi:hypothetical protein
MEPGQLESLPEIIECYGYNGTGSWPNISGANIFVWWPNIFGQPYTWKPGSLFSQKKFRYTFNNLWSKKVTFRLELNGQEFESLESFKIVKITMKE